MVGPSISLWGMAVAGPSLSHWGLSVGVWMAWKAHGKAKNRCAAHGVFLLRARTTAAPVLTCYAVYLEQTDGGFDAEAGSSSLESEECRGSFRDSEERMKQYLRRAA